MTDGRPKWYRTWHLIRVYIVCHSPAILHTFTGSKMDLLKRSTFKVKSKGFEYIWVNIVNLSKISHFSLNKILSQRGI